MSIGKTGHYCGCEGGLQNDEKLCATLVDFIKSEGLEKKLWADIGCGLGWYVKALRDASIRCDGFDGNPSLPELTCWLQIHPNLCQNKLGGPLNANSGFCRVLDASEPFLFENKYDWLLSLEVGEHIPKEFEDNFINNLHNNSLEGIILSWALVGQGGNGHYNEQDNDYIKSRFLDLGYSNDVEAETKLREGAGLWWFNKTIMVFRK